MPGHPARPTTCWRRWTHHDAAGGVCRHPQQQPRGVAAQRDPGHGRGRARRAVAAREVGRTVRRPGRRGRRGQPRAWLTADSSSGESCCSDTQPRPAWRRSAPPAAVDRGQHHAVPASSSSASDQTGGRPCRRTRRTAPPPGAAATSVGLGAQRGHLAAQRRARPRAGRCRRRAVAPARAVDRERQRSKGDDEGEDAQGGGHPAEPREPIRVPAARRATTAARDGLRGSMAR